MALSIGPSNTAVAVSSAWLAVVSLLVIVVAAEFAWPLTPLPLLIAAAIWLGVLTVPRQPSAALP